MEGFDNLAHQIVLMAIHRRTGELRKRTKLGAATAAAALAELSLQERLSVIGGKVRVHDARPTEDPLIDVMLNDLSRRPDRAPMRIIGDARDAYLNQALAELVANRWVQLTPAYGTVAAKYEILDDARAQAARALAHAGLMGPTTASDRAALLAGLANQLGFAKELAPELSFRQRLTLRQDAANRNWVNAAVRAVFTMSAGLDRL